MVFNNSFMVIESPSVGLHYMHFRSLLKCFISKRNYYLWLCFCAVGEHYVHFQIYLCNVLITLKCMFLDVPLDEYFIYHAFYCKS